MLDVSALEQVSVTVTRTVGSGAKKRTVADHVVDGVEASDAEFIEWAARRLGGFTIENRLAFRLLILKAMERARRRR